MKPTLTDVDPLATLQVELITNPDQSELRRLALAHTPAVLESGSGNLDKISRNKSRVAQYTYVIAQESDAANFSSQVIAPERARPLIERQREYIRAAGTLISIEGYIGLGERAVPVSWYYTLEGANIAGMQQILSFPREAVETPEQLAKPFQPAFRLVYTPNLYADGMPGRQAILVDLDHYVTYIMGPDYFGESKKGALRMLNKYIYDRGGLVLHAGAKAVKIGDRHITMTIMGLSGTGKTTTTFSKQGELTQPIQDDMVAIWPNGQCSITENGCFAKTAGLTAESEPVIYAGTISADAWVENVYLDEDGTYDFFKSALTPEEVARYRDILVLTGSPADNVDRFVSGEVKLEEIVDENAIPHDGWDFVTWTQNGRSIIPMSSVEDAADLHSIPPVQSMGILNRDEGPEAAMPGLVRFTSPEQAAGYFMIGETTKTSAAGKERGKTRSPFTQPFFPLPHGLQAKRFGQIAATMSNVDMWLMNTGFVGGDARDVERGDALKVKIRHSSAMLEAMLSGAVAWKVDPDFGYEIVDVDAPENAALVEAVGREILNPVLFFERAGRRDAYHAWVEKMNRERRAFLEKYDVDPAIVGAVARA